MTTWDAIWVNGAVATMVPGGAPYGLVDDGAVAVSDGRIAWVGPAEALPAPPDEAAARVHDLRDGLVTPGLVDCHTHLVFAGHRADEFEARLRGRSYASIAREGGGIRATVRSTRAATSDELLAGALGRAERLLRGGVTTMEVKSGYGLDVETELRLLRVARGIGEDLPVTVRTTLLGAHAVPPEYEGRRGEYVRLVAEEMIPRAAEKGLADAVDAFCEEIAFSPEECGRIFDAARERGLPVRVHADQLADSGGAGLAARSGARSADHLEHASGEGVRALAEAGTAAVLLPGAWVFLGGGARPPVEELREAGVPMAVATDANPGTSPVLSLLLAGGLGCALFGLTPEEALAGMTRVPARILGLDSELGTVETGKAADLAVWRVREPAELVYWMGDDLCRAVVKGGRTVRGEGAGSRGAG